MKQLFLTALIFISGYATTIAQTKEQGHFYDTAADARADIKAAVKQASAEGKNVLLQVGGNWCIWCTRFHNLVEKTDSLKALLSENYVVVPVNYDRKNNGDSLWKELGYPQRFGFPVFVILDGNGKRIHIQDSAYLEDGEGHSVKKVAGFLKQWTPAAVNGQL